MPDEPTPESGDRAEQQANPRPHEPHADPDAVLDAEIVEPTPAPGAMPVEPPDTGYTDDGVPTFDSVREKIETRYGTAIGAAELASETPEGRSVEEQYDARQKAAAERLAQIRESMRKDPDSR